MIPKIIHYCWFGGKKLPQESKLCIESWRKFFPSYEIKEWNESNFPLNCCSYVEEAYECKKWAFVSDYARFWILYNYGGIYFDTDVEVIKDMEDLIELGGIMGVEKTIDGKDNHIAPGLCIVSPKKIELFRKILDSYEKDHFVKDKNGNYETVVNRVTNIFKFLGYKHESTIKEFYGMNIFPSDFFCPINYWTGEIQVTENTRTIHHYSATWLEKYEINLIKAQRQYLKKKNIISFSNYFGTKIIVKFKKVGLKGVVQAIVRKFFTFR